VIGSTMGSPAEFKQVLDLLSAGALHPVIDRIYPLAEAAEAQRRLENREQFGKVLLQVAEPDLTARLSDPPAHFPEGIA
jgi:zinc-binding alcohol dehydrogenase/oxidoreductase